MTLPDTPSELEMDRGFAAHLRADPAFRAAVGCDPSRLADADILALHDLMRSLPTPPTGYGRLWADLMEDA